MSDDRTTGTVAAKPAKAKKPRFDQQGELSDQARVDAAMNTFVADFGRTAALHMESCVHCGLCASACHFHVTTGDPKYTPIHRLEPFRRAYWRSTSPLAPIIRALGLVKAPTLQDLQDWQELLYDSCTMCGRCTLACPMGIDIAELVKEARHGMFKAGLVPERLALIDRTVRRWGSAATPAEDLPEIVAEIVERHGVPIPCDLAKADILLTAAPAELGEHSASLAAAAKVLHAVTAKTKQTWTLHQRGFEATNIGFNNGDLELQEKLTRALIDTAVSIGARTVILPECGHAYGAARWEASRWYGSALPVRVVHMTEFLDESIAAGHLRLEPIGQTATFHDPCQIVRRGGLEDAARRVLAALGFDLREMLDHGVAGWCCGGGGGVVSNQRAAPLRAKVFELKKAQVEASGAERFVTSCGQCLITLEQGAKLAKWDRKTESLLELVAERLTS